MSDSSIIIGPADSGPFSETKTFTQGTTLATWMLAIITVCLRFFARRLAKAGLWYDDWLVIPATVS